MSTTRRDSVPQYLAFNAEVAQARERGTPIVALETTIVTHGMPYPENVATTRSVEAIVRAGGAVPATIAVFDGQIHVGLDDELLERFAHTPNVRKLSRADLPFAIASGEAGSTTVAATMICAALAGIEVFVTGGIGGVHRGAETSMDISADIAELVRTPVTVVCAGAKALLDLPKTLEALESGGVPVICYRTDEFPAFWSRSSGLAAPLRLDSAAEIARFVQVKRDLARDGGVLVANPIAEADEIPAAEMRPFIDEAVGDAERDFITGKDVTPFLLDRLGTLTAGRSLAANIALVENNARLGAELALALQRSRA
jgi:pseudouridine-5'-phosphate glycosidase